MASTSSAIPGSIDVSSLWASCLTSLSFPSASLPSPASNLSGLSSTLTSWETATSFLAPKTLEESDGTLQPTQEVVDAVNRLQEVGLVRDLLDWHTEQVVQAFESMIKPEVEAYVVSDIETLLIRLATYLQLWSQPHEALADALPSSSNQSPTSPSLVFRKAFLSRLHPLLTTSMFIDALRGFFSRTMDFATLSPDEQSQCTNAIRAVHYLSLLDRFEPLLFGLVYTAIEDRISHELASDFESEGLLSSLGEWLTGDIGEWLIGIYALAFGTSSSEAEESGAARARASKVLRPAMQRFEWHVYAVLFKMRVSELFDIIVDYPSSLPAIQDLLTCLGKTDQRNELVRALTRQIKKRLLHPGADTKDILMQYVSTIKVLRILDPPGVLLARITDEMRTYLRGRSDTIRCIVQGMVDEDGELLAELRGEGGDDGSGERAGIDLTLRDRATAEAEDYADEHYTWTPAPIDAPANFLSNRTADVIQLLVSIYDSTELFVAELQALLAERLLRVRDYDFSQDLRNVEVLKIRFGEQALQGLEVMLKDCADSKRIDTSLHAAGASLTSHPLHPHIISYLFWPAYTRSTLKLPGQLSALTKSYEKAYKVQKPEKKLQWFPNMGSVTLEIESNGEVLEVEVDMVKASVLELFSEKPRHTVQQISEALRLSELSPIKAALHFWAAKGLLTRRPTPPPAPGYAPDETQAIWQTTESLAAGGGDLEPSTTVSSSSSATVSAARPGSVAASGISAIQQPLSPEVLGLFEGYFPLISRVLMNLGTLPTARIHGMLLAGAPGYKSGGRTAGELEAYLVGKRGEESVQGDARGWKLAGR